MFEFNNKVLNNSIYKIKKNKMFFHVFKHSKRIEPIETIIYMIKNKKSINLFVKYVDEIGEILNAFILNDFLFTKINLTDFQGYDDIKTIKVKFEYSSIEYINNIDNLQIRKNKILKLLKVENNLLKKEHLF